jgi:predicted ferric reductase
MTAPVSRGIAWFGLYLAVVLLPLGVALFVRLSSGAPVPLLHGLAVAAGLVAFSLLTMQFGLVARIKSAARPFGSDALALFHRLLGSAALGFIVAHSVFLIASGLPLDSLSPVSINASTSLGATALWLTILLIAASLWRKRLRLRYGLWQASHSLIAVLAVLAALGHVLEATSARQDGLLAIVLTAYAVLFLALLLDYRVLRPLRLQRRPWVLVENRDEGASTRTLVLRPVGHEGLSFEPGQFAWLSTGSSAFGFDQHPLSLSGPTEPATVPLEFSIKALGDWSSKIVPQLVPGAKVYVDGPYGAFTPDRVPAQSFVLIAGGIGITPMRSILLTLRARGDNRRVLLIHAAHDPGRAIFREELAGLARIMNLVLVPVYESPPPDWRGERGLISMDLLRRHLPPSLAHVQFFVCGPPAMIEDVESALSRLGIRPEQFQSERFDLV